MLGKILKWIILMINHKSPDFARYASALRGPVVLQFLLLAFPGPVYDFSVPDTK